MPESIFARRAKNSFFLCTRGQTYRKHYKTLQNTKSGGMKIRKEDRERKKKLNRMKRINIVDILQYIDNMIKMRRYLRSRGYT